MPEGSAKNGWRIFGLKLRRMLYPSQYVVGGSAKFVAQLHRHTLKIHISRNFVEIVQGHHIHVENRKHP